MIASFNHADPEKTIDPALQTLIAKGLLQKGNTVVIISSITVGEQIVDAVQVQCDPETNGHELHSCEPRTETDQLHC